MLVAKRTEYQVNFTSGREFALELLKLLTELSRRLAKSDIEIENQRKK